MLEFLVLFPLAVFLRVGYLLLLAFARRAVVCISEKIAARLEAR